MTPRGLLVAAAMALACAETAVAQPAGHVEIAGGVHWFGTASFPVVNATQTAPGGTRRVVFRTESALGASVGGSIRVGVPVAPTLTLESTVSLNQPTLTTRISGDIESAEGAAASETVTQYVFEGGALVSPARWQRGRLEPFVAAGIGYLRQLNDGRTLVQTGTTWYGGTGVRYLLKRAIGGGTSSGVRVDVRATVLNGGVAVDGGRHVVPTLGGSVFLRF